MPDDFFRIRLVCNLLDTCGLCFDRGAAKKKLDFFLTFFQVRAGSGEGRSDKEANYSKYYIHIKETLPMDIDFIIQDTFALIRPQWKLAANLDEAGRAFAELVKQNYKSQEQEKALEAEEPDEGSSSDDEADDDELPNPEMDAQSSSDEAEAEVCNCQCH